MNKKRGFTLAEVLVTLGIIGVVAAVTLPALRSDTEKLQWEQGLKITVGNLNEGFARMLADYEADSLSDTKLFNEILSNSKSKTKYVDANKELGKYFNIDRSYAKDAEGEASIISGQEFYTLRGTDCSSSITDTKSIIYLTNGAKLHLMFRETLSTRNSSKYDIRIHIDVNGDKGPNTFGKDIFTFFVTDDGKVIARGSKTTKDLGIDSGIYWDTNNICKGDKPGGTGWYCAGRVVEEGYKIKYKF